MKETSVGPIILNDVRLAALFGHRDTWVRRLEKNGVIDRINSRQQRGLYDLEKALPRIVEYLLELNRKRYQDVKILETKERVRKLKLENAARAGRLISKEKVFAELAPIFNDLRRGFERLLLLGVPEGIIDEMIRIVEHGTNSNNGNAESASVPSAAEGETGSDPLD